MVVVVLFLGSVLRVIATRFSSALSSRFTSLHTTTPLSTSSYIMAPSDNQLEDILRNTVEKVYRSENQNDLTVRFVRDRVEHDLGLPRGFFSTPEWKDKSKVLIKSWAVSNTPLCCI